MVVVRRDNTSLLCTIVGTVKMWSDLPTFLASLKQQYEKEGYQTCWDDDRLKTGLIAWKEKESLFFGTYTKPVPRTRREFLW